MNDEVPGLTLDTEIPSTDPTDPKAYEELMGTNPTKAEVEAWCVEAYAKSEARRVNALEARLAQAETRIAMLEARPTHTASAYHCAFCGTYVIPGQYHFCAPIWYGTTTNPPPGGSYTISSDNISSDNIGGGHNITHVCTDACSPTTSI